MELSDIKFVIDLISIKDVNNYLQSGWKLINTYTVSYDPEIAKDDLKLHYVLGATSEIDYSKELSRFTQSTKSEVSIENIFN